MYQIEIEASIQRKIGEASLFRFILNEMTAAALLLARCKTPLILLIDLIDETHTVTVDGQESTETLVNTVALPTNFCRELYRCYSTTRGVEVDIFNNTHDLESCYERAKSGNVVGVCAEGTNLHYRNVPSTDDILQLSYYGIPVLSGSEYYPHQFMLGENYEVAWLPEEYQDHLIAGKAAAVLLRQLAADGRYGPERRQFAAAESGRLMQEYASALQALYLDTCGNRPKAQHMRYHSGSGRRGWR